MYLGKLLLRWLSKINENENDDCITIIHDIYCDVIYPEYLHVRNRYYKNQTPDSYQLRSAHYPPLVTATGFFRFSESS